MKQNWFKRAKEVLEIESQAILNLEASLNEDFSKAVDQILKTEGKVVVSGMGKSGIIGKKLAATLSSTGTPAFFLHPAEASHGDLGVVTEKDLVIAVSYGGNSDELDTLFNHIKRKGVKLIGVTGRLDSKLAKASDYILNVFVEKEACPLNLAPTASSTATLAMCDALAMVLLDERGFKEEDFAQFHPGGSLGRKLLTRVKDITKGQKNLPLVKEEDSAKVVVDMMTLRDVRGVCGVIDADGNLKGVITDGDVRRWLRRFFAGSESIEGVQAKDLMSLNPKCISENEMAQKALYLMEQFSISSLFVLGKSDSGEVKTVGLLHIQDLLDAKIK
jgi:arabinose-5-phosphate isomerase